MKSLTLPSNHPCLCGGTLHHRVGRDMFHGHAAALAVATFDNKRAGRKVKKVAVRFKHFVVVDA